MHRRCTGGAQEVHRRCKGGAQEVHLQQRRSVRARRLHARPEARVLLGGGGDGEAPAAVLAAVRPNRHIQRSQQLPGILPFPLRLVPSSAIHFFKA